MKFDNHYSFCWQILDKFFFLFEAQYKKTRDNLFSFILMHPPFIAVLQVAPANPRLSA